MTDTSFKVSPWFRSKYLLKRCSIWKTVHRMRKTNYIKKYFSAKYVTETGKNFTKLSVVLKYLNKIQKYRNEFVWNTLSHLTHIRNESLNPALAPQIKHVVCPSPRTFFRMSSNFLTSKLSVKISLNNFSFNVKQCWACFPQKLISCNVHQKI